ncbi:hypothetical protein ACJMK2_007940 [Sinanodonta woodiana]|uniref:Uncharacterized protein n=1 Tax=Sinanodonta woodiana TaxID=1069815 RepID=A0ABD3VK23_SINWO
MGLVIVQGSSLSEQVIKNINGNDNEGTKAAKVSRDISNLTYDTNDLEIKDNKNAIEPILVGDERKRQFDILTWLVAPILTGDQTIDMLKELGQTIKNSPVFNAAGKIADISLTIIRVPFESPEDAATDILEIVPKVMSLKKDLEGFIHCHEYSCTIEALGFNITAGYLPVDIGIFLSIQFLGFSVVNEKISLTGFRYCEPIELPIKKVKICIIVSRLELSRERACMNLGFKVLFISHTFSDLCLFGSRKTTS